VTVGFLDFSHRNTGSVLFFAASGFLLFFGANGFLRSAMDLQIGLK
jgi:hypothetical protein